MKYSICIVSYKAIDDLRRCLDSINASSIEDAEIVVWDNSPDPIFQATPDRAWSPRIPIKAFYNGHNYGFAEGCNRAAKQAAGDILIFLNPDTEVYGDWADAMHAHYSTKTDKPIGAIGPISDFVAGLQFFRHHMQEVEGGPEAMAAAAREALHGRAVVTKLLIGFCVMISADLYKEIGGMDGNLFLGCDDLDLSMRLREAGHELLIASDVFIRHAGHKSFEAAGAEHTLSLITKTEAAFRAKLLAHFGSQDKVPSSEDLWGCPIFFTGAFRPQTLSIVMIVREEEANLRLLLPQLGFADEVVLVDTSTGRAEDVQANMADCIRGWVEGVAPMLAGKIKMGMFPWVDDFAKARNHALSLATGDWVLWLDADDRIPLESGKLIRAAMDNPGPLTVQKKCHFSLIVKDFAPGGAYTLNAQQRLFPRIEGLYWEQAIHENYGDRANALLLPCITVPNILIEHHGYKDPVLNAKKQERNLRMLAAQEDSPHKLMHVANSYLALDRYEDARETLKKLLDMDKTWEGGLWPGLIAQTRFQLAMSYYKEFMGKLRAWQEGDVALRGAMPSFPLQVEGYCRENEKPDARFLLAEHHFFKGELVTAKTLYEEYNGFDYVDFYGTQMAHLQPAAAGRLTLIKKALEKIEA